MSNYLSENTYWTRGTYDAPNVESWIFRLPPIYFRKYGIPCSTETKSLDFGCGQGAAVQFFINKGYDAYGVDIAEKDLMIARNKLPDLRDHFKIIDPKPSEDDEFFKIKFDFILANQSLYYLSESELRIRLKSLYSMLKLGGYVYFTMMGSQGEYYRHSEKVQDGLRKVDIQSEAYKDRQRSLHGKAHHSIHYILFTHSKRELK